MDLPGDSRLNLEAAGDSSDLVPEALLPELSRSQTTLDGPPSPGLKKRKSQRTRPTDQQHAAPPAPLKSPVRQPELRPKVSKTMSLFSLFSKPKVEKLRGYAEQGLDVPVGPQRAFANNEAILPKQNVAVRVQAVDQEQSQTRPTTSRSYSARAARLISKEPSLPVAANPAIDRKPRAPDLTPLFQVWPQTIKHGILEVPSIENALQKPKSRTNTTPLPIHADSSLNVPGNRGSIESKMTIKSTIRHVRSTSNLALSGPPTKLFVLTTSGYLCQYTSEGNNERLPERVLRLGKDSAAYASDSVSGKHHVLKVAHAVDQHGNVVGDSQSIFSRFGMRGQPKRVASSFLIVMPNAEEMAVWMRAIRKEIETQGGKRARSDEHISRPPTAKPVVDLKKSPSVRYQIKRDPNGPSNISTPAVETPPAIELEGDAPAEPQTALPERVASEDDQATPTKHDDSPTSRPRAPSDTPSISSSAALSVDQQQLDKLRNSVRMSHASTAATSVMGAASSANSMASSPTDQFNDGSVAAKEIRSSYRSLSSATLAKRRSAAPLSLKDSQRTDSSALHPLQMNPYQDPLHSPVVGYASPIPEPTTSPKNQRLASAKSVPNLKTIAEPGSSLPFPMSTPAEERPESILADLPDPTKWKHSPVYRGSVIQSLPETQVTTDFSAVSPQSVKSRSSPTSRPLRNSSNSFSIPLRVNPIEPTSPRSPTTPVRSQFGGQEERVSSPVPAVTTLEAKVDIVKRTSIDASYIPPRRSSTSGSPPRDMQGKPNACRLSLFPTSKPLPPPPIMPIKGMRTRSPSAAAVTSFAPNPSMATSKRLARPASLQVRSDRAPFLASMRNTEAPVRSVSTVPIRALKPSRSAGNILAKSNASSTTDHKQVPAAKFPGDSEAADKITPLLDSLHSPLILGSVAHQTSRSRKGPRVRSSMPDLDVAALGPPAPPPSAPLPELPPAATPQAGTPRDRLSIIRAGTPIGLAIGAALDDVRTGSPTKTLPNLGLGIQVGGAS